MAIYRYLGSQLLLCPWKQGDAFSGILVINCDSDYILGSSNLTIQSPIGTHYQYIISSSQQAIRAST
ncbi:hypothetical protein H9X86_09700 [Pseudoflavonifractor capillosus]|uniref:hypothetical protein n=1 Tax=Pseudoflavonifractor capillosus TaxID=106588 RepID=UPI00195A6B0B|nr:hypothetical protein [Pseudoflavonifractor capillosus]MBM6897631.1 hypothetical protein [Pseudoflavonifractor capillosus]